MSDMWNTIFAAPVPTQPEWTWEATATIIQAVATVVALAGVGVTFYYSLRAERREHARTQVEAQLAREDAERSEASAERAERAAALSIDTMGRIAEAVEALGERGIAATVVPVAEPKRVRWSLGHHQNDAYILTNIGTSPAFDVRVTADPTMLTRRLPSAATIQPGEGVTFVATATMGTRDRTITVEWSSAEGDVTESWRYPLPPRPPRR